MVRLFPSKQCNSPPAQRDKITSVTANVRCLNGVAEVCYSTDFSGSRACLTSGQLDAISDPHEIYLLWPCSVPVEGQINSVEGRRVAWDSIFRKFGCLGFIS
jgi:hypothetical protein